ncbi:uncharacterized protein IWZ02DRAFT_201825 [Phyllosticta citriasiana]|uniref:uncharacterized protein n=1 Tax=Phyllosticta citriasiana TaxID=595635 RepID=UPI0030FD90E9
MNRADESQSLPQSRFGRSDMPPGQNELSVSNLPSGIWDINFRGSCPRCHQWHNRMLLRSSRLPGVWSGVRCQRCSFKWFNLSGDSRQITLISHQMVKLGPAHITSHRTLSTHRGEGLDMESFLNKWHSISAMDGPVLASTGPLKTLQDFTINLAPDRQSIIPGALDPSPPVREASAKALDLDGATENTSRQTSRGQAATLRGQKGSVVQSDTKRSPRQLGEVKEEKQSKGAAKMKTKIRRAIILLRGQGNLRREHPTPKSTTEPPAVTSQDESATPILRDGPKVERAKIRKPAPAAVSRSATIQHARCKSAPEEPQHRFDDEGFQPLLPGTSPIGTARQNIFPQNLLELRRPRSLVARPLLCACDPDCHCKRPSSSLIVEHALTDRASIYGLDLAQAEAHTRPSRRLHELAFIGTGFGGESTTSIQSSILHPQERSPSSSRRQRPTSLHLSSSSPLAYESQATTAYAQSEGATASDISVPTPRTSCFQQQQRDLFLLAPPAINSPRTRMPSPSSMATSSPSVHVPHQHQSGDRTSGSGPLAHNRNFFEHLAVGSVASAGGSGRAAFASPIQEAFDTSHSGPVSSLSTEDDADEEEDHENPNTTDPRVSQDNDSQGRQRYGHGSYYDCWRQQQQQQQRQQQRSESQSLEQRGSRSPGPLSAQPVT